MLSMSGSIYFLQKVWIKKLCTDKKALGFFVIRKKKSNLTFFHRVKNSRTDNKKSHLTLGVRLQLRRAAPSQQRGDAHQPREEPHQHYHGRRSGASARPGEEG